MNSYPEAYRNFRASTKAAVEFHDPNWTNSAITRERVKRLQQARAGLRAVLPAEATRTTVDPALRAAALDQLRPTDANTVAVAQNEWAKAKALIDSGRSLDQMLAQADRHRLAAILDRLPTELAVQSPNPEDAIAEVEGLLLDRLAELGDPAATKFATAQREADYEAAWAQVVEEALTGEPSVAALSALHRVAPEEHEATVVDDPFGEVDVPYKVQHLDRLAESVTFTAGAASGAIG